MVKKKIIFSVFALLVVGVALSQYPPIKSRLVWRVEVAKTYFRGIIYPARAVPTAQATEIKPLDLSNPTSPSTSTIEPTQNSSATPTQTPEPPPSRAALVAPEYELQRMNNCGPASLTMALRYYGWDGEQANISDIIKPLPQDRNVNPEEMVYYVRNYAGWLRAEYRVNGNLLLLKS